MLNQAKAVSPVTAHSGVGRSSAQPQNQNSTLAHILNGLSFFSSEDHFRKEVYEGYLREASGALHGADQNNQSAAISLIVKYANDVNSKVVSDAFLKVNEELKLNKNINGEEFINGFIHSQIYWSELSIREISIYLEQLKLDTLDLSKVGKALSQAIAKNAVAQLSDFVHNVAGQRGSSAVMNQFYNSMQEGLRNNPSMLTLFAIGQSGLVLPDLVKLPPVEQDLGKVDLPSLEQWTSFLQFKIQSLYGGVVLKENSSGKVESVAYNPVEEILPNWFMKLRELIKKTYESSNVTGAYYGEGFKQILLAKVLELENFALLLKEQEKKARSLKVDIKEQELLGITTKDLQARYQNLDASSVDKVLGSVYTAGGYKAALARRDLKRAETGDAENLLVISIVKTMLHAACAAMLNQAPNTDLYDAEILKGQASWFKGLFLEQYKLYSTGLKPAPGQSLQSKQMDVVHDLLFELQGLTKNKPDFSLDNFLLHVNLKEFVSKFIQEDPSKLKLEDLAKKLRLLQRLTHFNFSVDEARGTTVLAKPVDSILSAFIDEIVLKLGAEYSSNKQEVLKKHFKFMNETPAKIHYAHLVQEIKNSIQETSSPKAHLALIIYALILEFGIEHDDKLAPATARTNLELSFADRVKLLDLFFDKDIRAAIQKISNASGTQLYEKITKMHAERVNKIAERIKNQLNAYVENPEATAGEKEKITILLRDVYSKIQRQIIQLTIDEASKKEKTSIAANYNITRLKELIPQMFSLGADSFAEIASGIKNQEFLTAWKEALLIKTAEKAEKISKQKAFYPYGQLNSYIENLEAAMRGDLRLNSQGAVLPKGHPSNLLTHNVVGLSNKAKKLLLIKEMQMGNISNSANPIDGRRGYAWIVYNWIFNNDRKDLHLGSLSTAPDQGHILVTEANILEDLKEFYNYAALLHKLEPLNSVIDLNEEPKDPKLKKEQEALRKVKGLLFSKLLVMRGTPQATRQELDYAGLNEAIENVKIINPDLPTESDWVQVRGITELPYVSHEERKSIEWILARDLTYKPTGKTAASSVEDLKYAGYYSPSLSQVLAA